MQIPGRVYKLALITAFLLFVCGCLATKEVVLPHSGEKVSLSIINETKGQSHSIFAESKNGKNITYWSKGGSSSGGGSSSIVIHYSDSDIEYVFTDGGGGSVISNGHTTCYICTRGDCGFPVYVNRTQVLYPAYFMDSRYHNNSDKYPDYDNETNQLFEYRQTEETTCFSDGTYEQTIVLEITATNRSDRSKRKTQNTTTTSGVGCPVDPEQCDP